MNFQRGLFALCMLIAGSIFYPASVHAMNSDTLENPVIIDSTSSDTDSLTLLNEISSVDSTATDSLSNNFNRNDFQSFTEKNSVPDSKVKDKKQEKELDPESYHAKRAAKWAILPGGGQIYNKRWWKVPIAWAMIGAGGYFIYSSASDMRTYNRALDLRNSGQVDEFANILTEQQIVSYRNLYRRNLQLSTFGTVGLWTLTILDAVVDAHLKTYDISDNLSIKFKPKVLRVYNNSVPSFAITLYL